MKPTKVKTVIPQVVYEINNTFVVASCPLLALERYLERNPVNQTLKY
jgi:hypothetical protein